LGFLALAFPLAFFAFGLALPFGLAVRFFAFGLALGFRRWALAAGLGGAGGLGAGGGGGMTGGAGGALGIQGSVWPNGRSIVSSARDGW
jgi:hypothetical protein